MKQYLEIKQKHPDAILLFQVGDFYETFGADAIKAAEILGIVLTHRNNGASKIELAGFPHHSLDIYLPKLVRAGYRVAICEQLEKPSKEKKIVQRGITELVTPGITSLDALLQQKHNNFLASIFFRSGTKVGISFLDISTGEFLVSEGTPSHIDKLIRSFAPSEIIYAKDQKEALSVFKLHDTYQYGLDPWVFGGSYGREQVLDHFKLKNLKGFGIEEMPLAQVAAGAILHYLATTEHGQIAHITRINRIASDDYVWLDRFTMRNLELIDPMFAQGKSLLQVLDNTITPMGARMLRRWIFLPLKEIQTIKLRHDVVDYLVSTEEARDIWKENISKIHDLERLISKVSIGKVSPRQLEQLKNSLLLIPTIQKILIGSNIESLKAKADLLNPCAELTKKLSASLREELPSLVSKGGVFKDSASEELAEYRSIIDHAQEHLLDLQSREIETTGIQNLKIGYNRVFGYYLEVTNKYKNQGLIPDHWVRKQTLSGSERYITDELKVLEDKILNARELSLKIEETLYAELIRFTKEYITLIQQNASIIAELDCLLAFAVKAIDANYTRPVVDDSLDIIIRAGRHPVIEAQMPLAESYIPNDVRLNKTDQQILLITGPNMSGKSALLRQTALICLMAQIGSFVPATEAKIGILDRIFTRVGASDNISSGESTFMVEMNETSSIMNNISDRSLILMDEIGRGTSTYDGISIAWSIAEYLHENPTAKPKTLFATHYHELNELADKYQRIHNFHIATRETQDEVIFLRKLEPGGTAHSFGIHVAKMAGMPPRIIQRATQILSHLEKQSVDSSGQKEISKIKPLSSAGYQLQLFDAPDPAMQKVRSYLQDLDLHRITPIECMLKLQELKDILL